jgi:hypothetical protein
VVESQAAIGADALGLDWTIDISTARSHRWQGFALQGNLDPSVLLTTPRSCGEAARSSPASELAADMYSIWGTAYRSSRHLQRRAGRRRPRAQPAVSLCVVRLSDYSCSAREKFVTRDMKIARRARRPIQRHSTTSCRRTSKT